MRATLRAFSGGGACAGRCPFPSAFCFLPPLCPAGCPGLGHRRPGCGPAGVPVRVPAVSGVLAMAPVFRLVSPGGAQAGAQARAQAGAPAGAPAGRRPIVYRPDRYPQEAIRRHVIFTEKGALPHVGARCMGARLEVHACGLIIPWCIVIIAQSPTPSPPPTLSPEWWSYRYVPKWVVYRSGSAIGDLEGEDRWDQHARCGSPWC